MTPMELAYLGLVVVAAVIFMATLAGVTWWTNRR
jgi:hypothetical protein